MAYYGVGDTTLTRKRLPALLEETPTADMQPVDTRTPTLPPLIPTPVAPPGGVQPMVPPPIIPTPPVPGTQQVGPQGMITETTDQLLPRNLPPLIPTPPRPPTETYIPPRTTTRSAETAFGPGENLLGTQINPVNAPDTARARALTGQGLESLFSAPNRQDIALQTLKTLDERQADARKLGIQDIGRGAARLGRLGSGMVTTSLGDLESDLNRQREQTLRGLSADTAAQELSDRLNRLGASQSVGGQFYGQDVGGREELRGERGYQTDAEQRAINNSIQQFLLEQGAQAQEFGQQFDIDQLLAGAGFGSSAAVPLDVAQSLGAQGQDASGALGELLRQLAQRRGGGSSTTYPDSAYYGG